MSEESASYTTIPLYQALSRPFEQEHHREIGGGQDAPYVTGEQVTTRLNEVLGPIGWSFVVKEHGLNAEADEIWVLGALTLECGVSREQFGSQKIKRGRTSREPLDIGFDLKGAATDALKKCASLLGVGLYLSSKEQPAQEPAPQQATGRTQATHPYKLTWPEQDPKNPRQEFERWMAQSRLTESDLVFLVGRSIEEWCRQQETGYVGFTIAYRQWVDAGKRGTFLGAEAPRETTD